jgi:hypothetical protein
LRARFPVAVEPARPTFDRLAPFAHDRAWSFGCAAPRWKIACTLARLGVPEPGVAGACARAAGARLRARATAAVVTPRIPETIAAAVVADRQPGPVADRLHPDLDAPRPRVRRDVPERFLSAPVEERLGGGA